MMLELSRRKMIGFLPWIPGLGWLSKKTAAESSTATAAVAPKLEANDRIELGACTFCGRLHGWKPSPLTFSMHLEFIAPHGITVERGGMPPVHIKGSNVRMSAIVQVPWEGKVTIRCPGGPATFYRADLDWEEWPETRPISSAYAGPVVVAGWSRNGVPRLWK